MGWIGAVRGRGGGGSTFHHLMRQREEHFNSRKFQYRLPRLPKKRQKNDSTVFTMFSYHVPGASVLQAILESFLGENACPSTVQNSEYIRGGLPLTLANAPPVKPRHDVGDARSNFAYASRGSETLDHLDVRTGWVVGEIAFFFFFKVRRRVLLR